MNSDEYAAAEAFAELLGKEDGTVPVVTLPPEDSEATIQAKLWAALSAMGHKVAADVSAVGRNGKRHRLDLVVFVEGHAALIIEVKKPAFAEQERAEEQAVRYWRAFAVNVVIVSACDAEALTIIRDALEDELDERDLMFQVAEMGRQ